MSNVNCFSRATAMVKNRGCFQVPRSRCFAPKQKTAWGPEAKQPTKRTYSVCSGTRKQHLLPLGEYFFFVNHIRLQQPNAYIFFNAKPGQPKEYKARPFTLPCTCAQVVVSCYCTGNTIDSRTPSRPHQTVCVKP